jgi:hypothetical protein
MGQDPLVNASGEANGAFRKDILVPCACCLKLFRPYRRSQLFCGARCRLLHWSVSEVVEELNAGRAEGLRDLIERLKP